MLWLAFYFGIVLHFISVDSFSTNSMKLILGSASSSRKAILTKFRIPFETTVPADIDEESFLVSVGTNNPERLVTAIAVAKSDAIISRVTKTNDVLVTGDSVVLYKNQIRNKPQTSPEAEHFLKTYRNDFCTVVSGMVLTNITSLKRVSGVRSTIVHFGDIPDPIIEELVAKGDIMHCAGGLMVEHPLLQPYITLQGEQECATGLSIDLLKSLWTEITDGASVA